MACGPTPHCVVSPGHILAPLLVRRGITDADSAATFLSPSLSISTLLNA